MSAKNSREERTYRRGLVMGLTMAEIMVLVIFALLLILAKVLNKEPSPLPASFVTLMDSWRKAGTSVNEFDDKARELITSAELGSAVTDALKDSNKGQGSTEGAGSAGERGFVKRMVDLVETGRQAEAAVGENSMGVNQQQATRDFLRATAGAFNHARHSNGFGSAQIWLTDLIKKAELAEGSGKGTEHPPCSSTAGKPDFIFDVHLGSTTITVHDNELPEVASKRLAWPLSPIEFDKPVARPTFLAMTNALFQWSAERQCRFFVRIVDDTLAHEKAIYKVQLRTVGYHFYYYEPLGSAFGGQN